MNYQKELDREIEKIKRQGRIPSLLLHSCCAPCSSYVLEYLSQYFSITVYYFNPNIAPQEEYDRRVREQKNLIERMPLQHTVSFRAGSYDPELFYHAVRGLEQEPEGGRRCEACFGLRLTETARVAKKNNFDFFTTTLTISPLKNVALLNALGYQISETIGVHFLPSDFKKRGGYQRSIELSHEYDLYRQNYCGCVFSKRD